MTSLAATGVAFVMASYIGEAFSDQVLWFAIPYIIIRILGAGLYSRVAASLQEKHTALIIFIVISSLGLVCIYIGANVEPSQRIWWWLAAILLDIIAAFISGRLEGFRLFPKHFSERHGLIVIIALGESLIVAAAAVADQEQTIDLLYVGGLSVIITCLLWWSYFAWISEHLEEYFSKLNGVKMIVMA